MNSQSEKGFSLISTLVAVAIAGIVAVSLAAMMGDLFSFMGRSTDLANINNLQQMVTGMVLNPASCDAALAGLNFPNPSVGDPPSTVDIPMLRWQNGTSALAPGQVIPGSPRVRINGLKYRELTPVNRNKLVIGGTTYNTYGGTIVMQACIADKAGNCVSNSTVQERQIPVSIAVTNAGSVARCAQDSGFEQLCQALGGVATDTTCKMPSVTSIIYDCNGKKPCPGPPPGAVSCTPVYYMDGYVQNASNQTIPNCQCQLACQMLGPPVPVPGPPVPVYIPVPGGGGGGAGGGGGGGGGGY
jgi:hypothetical protein